MFLPQLLFVVVFENVVAVTIMTVRQDLWSGLRYANHALCSNVLLLIYNSSQKDTAWQ